MIQPATATSVLGDFRQTKLALRNQPYDLRAKDGAYFVTESYLTGKPVEHRIDYTLGSRRIQHYLTTLPDGRIIVLPPSWDVQRKQWFHNFDVGDPDESGEVEVQLWNKQCFGCHVSQEVKNFNPAKAGYQTSWNDFGTNCERCHGAGAEHIQLYSKTARAADAKIVVQTRLDPSRNSAVCGQCHSFRDIYVPNFAAGNNYYDHFLPILEYNQPVDKDPAYWPDGRTRRFSNDAIGFWQSQCFVKGGATCLSCHVDAHDTGIEKSAQLRPDASAICTRCHVGIGRAVPAHTHHPENSAGSSCVECHMPRTVLSIKAKIRDHSMSVPVPANTLRHQIPNACNECHQEKDAKWAAAKMTAWWGERAGQREVKRTDAFAAARRGEKSALEALLAILADGGEVPLHRANAVGYLGRFPKEPAVFPAFVRALQDPADPVRAVAALRINAAAEKESAVAALGQALQDRVASVRLGAAVSLAALELKEFPTGFDAARQLYAARNSLNNDDPMLQFSAGKFFLLAGDPQDAAEALRTSIQLDPTLGASYFLAYAYAMQGKYADARSILESIPVNDPQRRNALELLAAIRGR